jgi:nucleoid DNA-binding protein
MLSAEARRVNTQKPVLHWTFRACRYILCAVMRPWVARENSNGRGKTVAKAPVKKVAAVKAPEKLTSASMIGYLAEKSGLARKDVKQVMEDLYEIVGTGVMRGERVALGKIGKMFIRMRPARAARIGRNPLTGQDIAIPAKPATKVPRFTFSKTFKEAALKAKVKK